MFLVTQYFQAGIALVDLVLAALVDATPGPILDITAKVHLYKAGPAPAFNSVLGAFTECDFDGYAAVTLAAVIGPINLPGGQGVYQMQHWLRTAVVQPTQSAMGMYVTDSAAAVYLGGEQFITPVPFNIVGDGLDYQFVLAPRSLWGGESQG